MKNSTTLNLKDDEFQLARKLIMLKCFDAIVNVFYLTSTYIEILYPGSLMAIGATIGCVLAGSAMNFLGRRGATLVMTAPAYLSGYLLIGFATNGIMVISGRSKFKTTKTF